MSDHADTLSCHTATTTDSGGKTGLAFITGAGDAVEDAGSALQGAADAIGGAAGEAVGGR